MSSPTNERPDLAKLLTIHDVSKILGVRIATLRNWRSTKRYNLPYIKLGGKILYLEKDVTEFLQKLRVTPNDNK